MVHSRDVANGNYTFGVSGRLYKSNVLIYDHQTESLWSQLMSKAVSGPMAGKELELLPFRLSTWKNWKSDHPGTLVLSTDTGHQRDYSRDPYTSYDTTSQIWFPVGNVRKDLGPKERVLGITADGRSRAWSLKRLSARPGRHKDDLGDKKIVIEVSEEGEVAAVNDDAGDPVPHVFVYWFAWQAFHPDTTVNDGL